MSSRAAPLRDQARTGSIETLTGAMLVFALLLSAGPTAQAMAPRPEPEDIANAAALMGAPWLVCESGPDPVAGIPAGMDWNWDTKDFDVRNDEPQIKKAEAVFLFDDEKRRGKIMISDGARLSAADDSDFVESEGERLRPYAVAFRTRDYVIVITRRRTADGGFLGIVQSTGNRGFFSLDPAITLVPFSCVPSADDALTRRIERARDEWLTATPTTESPKP